MLVETELIWYLPMPKSVPAMLLAAGKHTIMTINLTPKKKIRIKLEEIKFKTSTNTVFKNPPHQFWPTWHRASWHKGCSNFYKWFTKSRKTWNDSLHNSDANKFVPLFTTVELTKKRLSELYEVRREVSFKVRNLRAIIKNENTRSSTPVII